MEENEKICEAPPSAILNYHLSLSKNRPRPIEGQRQRTEVPHQLMSIMAFLPLGNQLGSRRHEDFKLGRVARAGGRFQTGAAPLGQEGASVRLSYYKTELRLLLRATMPRYDVWLGSGASEIYFRSATSIFLSPSRDRGRSSTETSHRLSSPPRPKCFFLPIPC